MITFKLPDKDWGQEKFPAIKRWICEQVKQSGGKIEDMAIEMTREQALALAMTKEIMAYVDRNVFIHRAILESTCESDPALLCGIPTKLYGIKVHVI